MQQPHYLEHRKRLRQRFRRTGFDGFGEYEALELLLTYAIPRRDVKPLSKEMIKRFGSLRGVLDAPYDELASIKGLDENAATYVTALKEAAVLYRKQRLEDKRQISSTPELLDYLDAAMAGLRDEQFRMLCLNSQNEVVSNEVIAQGTVNESAVYPRKVMERALHNKAAAVIFVHNHPGGKCKPSPQDIKLTSELVKIAKSLGIAVHDHMIVCTEGYFSFLERGML